jgi:hypothetical protein
VLRYGAVPLGFANASLLLKQSLQCVFGLLSPVAATTSSSCPLGAPRDIVVAEIGPLLIENAFGRDFLAFIVGVLVVKVALLTTAQISIAMGTGILPVHLPLNSDHIPAKDTIHCSCSSYPNRAKKLGLETPEFVLTIHAFRSRMRFENAATSE